MTTMSEPLHTGPYGRLNPHQQEWTPASAVSSFNLPLIYDSTLTTPVSLSAESPGIHVHKEQHWRRSESNTMQYPPRSYDGVYPYHSIHSKPKEMHPSNLSVPSDDMSLSISPFVYDSPQSPGPPTPYWGNFGVSAPQTGTNTTTTSEPPNPSFNAPSSSSVPRNKAPILLAPTPANLRPPKRAHDENLSPRAHQAARQTQQQLQQQAHQHAQQAQAQAQQQQLEQSRQQVHIQARQQLSPSFSPQLKRELPSPISATSTNAPSLKRRKQSSPPTPYSNPPSAHPSSATSGYPSSHPTPSQYQTTPYTASSIATPQTSNANVDILTEQERLLLHLKEVRDRENFDWKEVAIRFNQACGSNLQIPCLQMRLTRLLERLRVWSDVDIQALIQSKHKHNTPKWKIIAEGMLEFGCERKWTPRSCQLKWQELHPEDEVGRRGSSESMQKKGSRFTEDDEFEGEEIGTLRGKWAQSHAMEKWSREELAQAEEVKWEMEQDRERALEAARVAREGGNFYGRRADWTVRPQQ